MGVVASVVRLVVACPQTVDNRVDLACRKVGDAGERPGTGVDGRRSATSRPAHRSGLVLHVPGRRAARGQRRRTSRISVPSNHVRDRILTRYLPLVTEALDDIVAPGCALDIVVAAGRLLGELDTVDDAGARGRAGARHRPRTPDRTARRCSTRPGSTRATRSRRSSRAPPTSSPWPPRCGSPRRRPARTTRCSSTAPPGLGKTHLLHAIGHYVHHNYQHHEVRYVSTETFLNEFVDAIRTNTGNAFKRRYRDIDVLLIDDIQFLENREGLQEEFFHTFNSLHGANKQIVISSRPRARRHPDARGAPARPLQVGPDHRHPAARPGDPPGDPAQQGRARPGRGARRDARVHRHQDLHQHPRARGRADPGHRLRQPQPRPDHHRAGPAPARRPAARGADPSRAPTRSCSPRSPASSASRSTP